MNSHHNGYWQDQYGNYHPQIPNQAYETHQYAGQPMVVVPQASPQELQGFQYPAEQYSYQYSAVQQPQQHVPYDYRLAPQQPQGYLPQQHEYVRYGESVQEQRPVIPSQRMASLQAHEGDTMLQKPRRRSSGSRRPLTDLPGAHLQPKVPEPTLRDLGQTENLDTSSTIQARAKPHVKPAPETTSGIDTKLKASRRQSAHVVASVPSAASPESCKGDNDHQLVLLALAEQYVSAARSLASRVARGDDAEAVPRYQTLMVHGLSCLDAVLKNWRLVDPRLEASLRLRYATLLFEETDDDNLAQSVLSKGITICDRSKLTHYKWSMHYLLARIQYKSNPRAAFHTIDSVIDDLVTFRNVPWVYAFRLLKLSLAMQRSQVTDVSSMLQQTRALIELAQSRSDISVFVLANILDAFIHLRMGGNEHFELATRAIAAARSYQLDTRIQGIPPLQVLLLLVDLSCDLSRHVHDQINEKTTALQRLADRLSDDEQQWTTNSFQLPLTVRLADYTDEDFDGVLRKDADGQISIAFRWLSKAQLLTISFLISGLASLQLDCVSQKAENFFTEGAEYAKKSGQDDSAVSTSLTDALESTQGDHSHAVAIQLYHVLALCNRSKWASARKILDRLESSSSIHTNAWFSQLIDYLSAVTYQGQGDLDSALRLYSSVQLMLPDRDAKAPAADTELRLLSALSRVAILYIDENTSAEAMTLLDRVTPLCDKHPDPSMRSACKILRTASGRGIVDIKMSLNIALSAAQRVKNPHLVAQAMNLMILHMFINIVGEQAVKSVNVAFILSQKAKSPLLMAISCSNLAKSLELHGKHAEAAARHTEAEQYWHLVPEAVRKRYEDE